MTLITFTNTDVISPNEVIVLATQTCRLRTRSVPFWPRPHPVQANQLGICVVVRLPLQIEVEMKHD